MRSFVIGFAYEPFIDRNKCDSEAFVFSGQTWDDCLVAFQHCTVISASTL